MKENRSALEQVRLTSRSATFGRCRARDRHSMPPIQPDALSRIEAIRQAVPLLEAPPPGAARWDRKTRIHPLLEVASGVMKLPGEPLTDAGKMIRLGHSADSTDMVPRVGTVPPPSKGVSSSETLCPGAAGRRNDP